MAALVILVVVRNSRRRMNIEPNLNWHHQMAVEFAVVVDRRRHSPDLLMDRPMPFELDHRRCLVVDRPATLRSNPTPTMDRRNRTNAGRDSSCSAIERDSTATKAEEEPDWSTAIAAGSIATDFGLADYPVGVVVATNCKTENVVVARQEPLVDIATVDATMPVENVVVADREKPIDSLRPDRTEASAFAWRCC